jgi:hypothetical protein
MTFDISPYLASGRYVVVTSTAMAAGFGIHSMYGVSTDQIKTGFDHIFNGLNEIAVGVGVLAPIAMGVWGTMAARLSSKVADVHAASPMDLVQAVHQVDASQLVEAMKTVAPATLVNAAAELPSVHQIIASDAMEKATASQKVVS